MVCSRCNDPSPRLITCYWNNALAICPPCCQEVADLLDSRDQWPAVPGGVPADLSEMTP